MCSMPTDRRIISGEDAYAVLLFLGELPVRGGRRMACERFGIADIHEAFEEVERVVELHAGVEAAPSRRT